MGIEFITRKGITAPANFWKMTPSEYKLICNGAGPKGWGWLVPDTMWGLNVKKAADIHDYMYYWAIWPRKLADKIFLDNMLHIINYKGGYLKYARRIRAHTYHSAVRLFGSSCYGD